MATVFYESKKFAVLECFAVSACDRNRPATHCDTGPWFGSCEKGWFSHRHAYCPLFQRQCVIVTPEPLNK
jgi:hypothetical protein